MAAYTIFDNTDGKQARRTGSSSFVGEVLDHGVDMTVVTLSSIIFSDATGIMHDHPYFAVTVYAGMGAAQYFNNWYHSITGKMSWGGEWLSIDEALVVNIAIIAYRWYAGPDVPLFNYRVFTVPEDYRDYTTSMAEDDGSIKLVTLACIGIVLSAVTDCWSKLIDSIEHATNKGTLKTAYETLLPIVLFDLCFFFFMPAKAALPAYVILCGAVFAQVGCRLIMLSTSDSKTLAWQQHVSMFLSFSVFFVQETAGDVVQRVLSSFLDESTAEALKPFSAGILAWAIFGAFFVAGVREINFSKGGGSMFVIVKKD